MHSDIIDVIKKRYQTLSKSQKLIANYILKHYDKSAFMTAAKLGAAVGVSESTVVRFATELEFEGYPQLQRAMQEMIRTRLTAIQRMELTNESITPAQMLGKVLNSDAERIKNTLEEMDEKVFENAVDAIISAKTIYILGIRSSSILASFLSFYLSQIFPNVRLVTTVNSSEIFEQLFRIDAGDVIVSITFPRYSSRTIKATQFAKSRGASVVVMTDTAAAPVAEFADYLLLAHSDMASFVDSLVAPLSLLNAIIVAIGMRLPEEVSKAYEVLENIWSEQNVYEKHEDNKA